MIRSLAQIRACLVLGIVVNKRLQSAEDEHPMMNNNKILTVSYGTFSCTLEGFDDSFGTMKAIAEYFRDLAADDRYFGAEPPQPDADMLARIAQREVSRKVQAHERDGKIVLSALEDQRVTPPAPTIAEPAQAELPQTADTAPISAPETVEEVTVQETAPMLDDADVVTREENTPAIDSEDATETEDNAVLVATTDVQDPTDLSDPFDTPRSSEAEYEEDENDIVPGQPDADVKAFFADSTLNESEDETPAARDIDGATESITAKLQRIRAVVAKNKDNEDASGYAEDQHADTSPRKAAAQNVVNAARSDIEDALDVDDALDQIAAKAQIDTDAAQEDASVTENAVLQELVEETPSVDRERLAAKADALIEDELEDENDDVDAILERLAAVTSADSHEEDDDLSSELDENLFEDEAEPEKQDTSQSAEDFDQPDVAAAQEAPRARVIKVKRADLEAAIRKGALEEYDDEEEDEVSDDTQNRRVEAPKLDQIAPSRSKSTSLTPQDQDELARELANLEMDIEAEKAAGTDQAKEEMPQEERARRRRNKGKRAELSGIDEERSTDVNRLLAEADQQMDEPESANRRDAFSHLRAAVAAKKADVAMGKPEKEETSDDAYRGDLAEVVRPRRPTGGGNRTARPNEGRPAPLKLVAEQRVDLEQVQTRGPVRPRRVAAAVEPASRQPEGESFADYAAEMGATSLPQLLEAAASYMSFVEGHEQFSRPQLMNKVRQAGNPEDFSREDGLRSFGQLLRTGKIAKIKGGRFTVSDDIGFQPDERDAG